MFHPIVVIASVTTSPTTVSSHLQAEARDSYETCFVSLLDLLLLLLLLLLILLLLIIHVLSVPYEESNWQLDQDVQDAWRSKS